MERKGGEEIGEREVRIQEEREVRKQEEEREVRKHEEREVRKQAGGVVVVV